MKKLAVLLLLLTLALVGCTHNDTVRGNITYLDAQITDHYTNRLSKTTHYYLVINRNKPDNKLDVDSETYQTVVDIIHVTPKIDNAFTAKFDIVVDPDHKVKAIALSSNRK